MLLSQEHRKSFHQFPIMPLETLKATMSTYKISLPDCKHLSLYELGDFGYIKIIALETVSIILETCIFDVLSRQEIDANRCL